MNKHQRQQNRKNAEDLRKRLSNSVICKRCGKPGKHYMLDPVPSIGGDCSGWICDEAIASAEGWLIQVDSIQENLS